MRGSIKAWGHIVQLPGMACRKMAESLRVATLGNAIEPDVAPF